MVSTLVRVWTVLVSLSTVTVVTVGFAVPVVPEYLEAGGSNLYELEVGRTILTRRLAFSQLLALMLAFNLWATALVCASSDHKVRRCGCYLGLTGACAVAAVALFMVKGALGVAPGGAANVAFAVAGTCFVAGSLVCASHCYYVQRVFSPALARVQLSGQCIDILCDFCVQSLFVQLLYQTALHISWVSWAVTGVAGAGFAPAILVVAIPCVLVVTSLSISRFDYVVPTMMATQLAVGWQYVSNAPRPPVDASLLASTRIVIGTLLASAAIVAAVRRRCYLIGRLCP